MQGLRQGRREAEKVFQAEEERRQQADLSLLKQLEEKELNGLLRRVTTLKQQGEVYGRYGCDIGRRRCADINKRT